MRLAGDGAEVVGADLGAAASAAAARGLSSGSTSRDPGGPGTTKSPTSTNWMCACATGRERRSTAGRLRSAYARTNRAAYQRDFHIRYARDHASVALWAASDEEDLENYRDPTKHLASRPFALDPQRSANGAFVSGLGATSLPTTEVADSGSDARLGREPPKSTFRIRWSTWRGCSRWRSSGRAGSSTTRRAASCTSTPSTSGLR